SLAALPMALPPLQRAIFSRAAGRWGEEPPPYPEMEKPDKPEKRGREDTGDELEALDRIGQEHGGKGLKRRQIEIPADGPARIPTVADIVPLPPEEKPPPKLREKTRGEEGIKATVDAFAAESGEGPQQAQGYRPPSLDLLGKPGQGVLPDRGEEEEIAYRLVKTLENFGVSVELVGRSRGPAVTRYELRPAEGVKISKITSLSDDIALRLAATKVRIEAPIPGKPAVGVEIPNKKRAIVTLRELVGSEVFVAGAKKSKLTVALGKDIVGDLVCADLAKLPHLLIAGTTGSGKSVCMNALILSLMYNASPEDVKMVMVDPKQVEFNVYSGIPHLLVPVVSDPIKAAGALGWAVNAMEKRYTMISEQNVRDIDSYNNIAAMQDDLEHLPRLVIFIDELSDLMMVAPGDVEDSIQRLSQKGRAAGIHLVVSTQRPSVDVITGVIKSNLPGRIALSVASQIDSRTIINSMGAEQLLGNGDMLFSVNGGNNAIRVQGCYVSDAEVRKVVSFVKEKDPSREGYDDGVWEEIDRFAAQAARGKKKGGGFDLSGDDAGEEDDPMLDAAIEVVVNAQLASTTMLQKKLKLGYARASRLVDLLEARGVVGPPEGAKPRKVLMSPTQWQEYSAMGPGKKSFSGEEE
ncbi:MAG: DNA translocase FtsK, partial [Firmicutes bacterium]|nr:DNA translocase FtsK [Bacillota bacterium]